jgi:hypothetical protein
MVRARIAVVLGAGAAVLSLASHARSGGCDSVVGQWLWFTGGLVSIRADGTIAHDPGNVGTWECADPGRTRVVLRWHLGGFVNRLELSADGQGLFSTDPSQSYVTARRAAAPPPRAGAEPPRASPSRPEPPRATAAPPEPKAGGSTPAPAPRAADVPTPAAKGPGRCVGDACVFVSVIPKDGCVWLRSSSREAVHAEIRLERETVEMTLEAADLAKSATRASETSGHGTIYDVFTSSDVPVFLAQVRTRAGCVKTPEAITRYKVTLASSTGGDDWGSRLIPCSGNACQDLERSFEGVSDCQLTNRGTRQVEVGIISVGNRSASMFLTLAPKQTRKLPLFVRCEEEIGGFEATYK